MAIWGAVSKSGEMTLEDFKEWLKQFDVNGDGRISKSELKKVIKHAGKRFAFLKYHKGLKYADANHDGFIDDDEINKLAEFVSKNLGMKITMC